MIKKIVIILVAALTFAYLECQPLIAPITDQGGQIDEPGSYELEYDIFGTVTINSSNVILNLAGHEITGGVTIMPTFTLISVVNGTIDGDGGIGIQISAGINGIILADLYIVGCSTGIKAEGSSLDPIYGLTMDNVYVFASLSHNIDLNYCNYARLNGVLGAASLTGHGLILSNSLSAQFNNCLFANSNILPTSKGLVIDGGKCHRLIECRAENNGQHGFEVTSSAQGIIFEHCTALENGGAGFSVSGHANLDTCKALFNDDGFSLAGTTNMNLISCRASNNTSSGFDDATGATSTARYANNLSYGNTNDYANAGVGVLPGLPPYNYLITFVGSTYWDNVQG